MADARERLIKDIREFRSDEGGRFPRSWAESVVDHLLTSGWLAANTAEVARKAKAEALRDTAPLTNCESDWALLRDRADAIADAAMDVYDRQMEHAFNSLDDDGVLDDLADDYRGVDDTAQGRGEQP